MRSSNRRITSPGAFEGYFDAMAGVAAGTVAKTREDVLREYRISEAVGWEEDLRRRYGVRVSI